MLFYFPQLFVGKIFQIDQLVSRLLQRANDFVELQMHRFSVAVLGVLNQEHHQKRNDGSSSVDDQLPGVGKMKCWTSEKPDQDHEQVRSQTRITSMAPAKAQALPSMMEERRAKTRKASLTTQKKSRSFSCSFSFSVWV